jgi:hypothetical protein
VLVPVTGISCWKYDDLFGCAGIEGSRVGDVSGLSSAVGVGIAISRYRHTKWNTQRLCGEANI